MSCPSNSSNPPLTETPKPAAEHRRAGGSAPTAENRGGRGNPFNRQIGAFRKMIVGTTTLDDVRVATEKLIAAAREGNLAAIKPFSPGRFEVTFRTSA